MFIYIYFTAVIIIAIYGEYLMYSKRIKKFRSQISEDNPRVNCYGYVQKSGEYTKIEPIIIKITKTTIAIIKKDGTSFQCKTNEVKIVPGGLNPRRWLELRIIAPSKTWIVIPFHPFYTYYISALTLPKRHYKTGKFNLYSPGFILESRDRLANKLLEYGAKKDDFKLKLNWN